MSEPLPPQPGDRNLLFGLLALQMDFIERDALVAAMHTRVLEKNKPLGEILVQQGALRTDAHALLESLVKKHLEVHGDDAEKSLAAVSSVGSVREELQHIADPQLQASLTHISVARRDDEADPFGTRTETVGALISRGQRFRVLRPHAKGGAGRSVCRPR